MKKTQKTIISASRRTDIPAFHSEWFMKSIRAGYCVVPNPLYPRQKTKPIGLKPEDVAAIVFWTRDPAPLMQYLPELDSLGYKYYFLYSVLGYPAAIDPGSPGLDKALDTFCRLSDMIGKDKVIWRYDPILFSNLTPLEWHMDNIELISGRLKGRTKRLIFSIIDPYKKTTARMNEKCGESLLLDKNVYEPDTYLGLAKWLGEAMKGKGLRVFTCAENIDLSRYGIEHGKCIDDGLIRGILSGGDNGVSGRKDPAQRESCGCVKARDIGVNNTCLFGCKYCYATSAPGTSNTP